MNLPQILKPFLATVKMPNLMLFTWGLIHNAHLRKFPSFCQILDFNITYLKCVFNKFFDFMPTIAIEAWHLRVKIVYNCHINPLQVLFNLLNLSRRLWPTTTGRSKKSTLNLSAQPLEWQRNLVTIL